MSRAGGSGRHGDGIRDHPVIDGGKLLALPGRMRLAERMRIERWDSGDTATAMACFEVFLAAHAADEPIEPPELGYEVVEPGYRHCELAVDGVR
jgi:hypothetical protein